MNLDNNDFSSLIEMWILLEVESARLAALRRTEQDILAIKEALDVYANKVIMKERPVAEDLQFHLNIAEASKNQILKSLISVMRPKVINNSLVLENYNNRRSTTVLEEHKVIMESVIAQESEKAGDAMRRHLNVFLF